MILLIKIFNFIATFRWTGRYLDADLSWTLPSPSGVHICTILKENSTLMTFSKNGELLKKTDIGINIVDGGTMQFLGLNFWV